MLSLLGIVFGIAAVLAVLVTAAVIAVCLSVRWMTDTFRGARPDPPREVRGGARPADHDASFSGRRPQQRSRHANRLAYG
ncbi:MAG: hypothetical protein ACRDOI_45695 [Trebonia sp.]